MSYQLLIFVISLLLHSLYNLAVNNFGFMPNSNLEMNFFIRFNFKQQAN